MTAYRVTAFVQVALKNGGAVQLGKGADLPDNVADGVVKHLLDFNLVEKVEDPEPDGPAPGTEKFILAEVGEDKAKAQVALDEENAKEKPRKGLVASLEKILAG